MWTTNISRPRGLPYSYAHLIPSIHYGRILRKNYTALIDGSLKWRYFLSGTEMYFILFLLDFFSVKKVANLTKKRKKEKRTVRCRIQVFKKVGTRSFRPNDIWGSASKTSFLGSKSFILVDLKISKGPLGRGRFPRFATGLSSIY